MKTEQKVIEWAHARNLIKGGTPQAQIIKLMEEAGETAGALLRNKPEGIKDGIGDCVVVLTILAAQCGLTLSECFEAAYKEIAPRRGRMENGVFVKEADLQP